MNKPSRDRARVRRTLRRIGSSIFISLLYPILCMGQQLTFSQPLIARWQYLTADTINLTPATHDGHVYLPLADGKLVALSAADGQLIWQTDMGGAFSSAPEADERGVYVATE